MVDSRGSQTPAPIWKSHKGGSGTAHFISSWNLSWRDIGSLFALVYFDVTNILFCTVFYPYYLDGISWLLFLIKN